MVDRKKPQGPSPLERYVREKLMPEASTAEQDAVVEAWRGYIRIAYRIQLRAHREGRALTEENRPPTIDQ